MSEPSAEQGELGTSDLLRRARIGVVAVTSRGMAIAALALGGQLFLTHLLVPADFGAAAIGLATVAFINLFADGGLGAALIRRQEAPHRAELQALSGLQVGIATALTMVVFAVAPFFGRVGWVTAVIVCSAPVLCLQIPARIVLERSLRFEKVARIEVVQVLVFYVWAIGLVLGGGGVWGIATAPLVRSLVGLILLTRASPMGTPAPRFSWKKARPLLRFGLQFQSVTALWLMREQGLNIGIAAVAGIGTLGLASLGRRVLEIPYLILHALFRVSFPTMSKLVVKNDNLGETLIKIVRVCATGMGLGLAGLAASSPGVVPSLLGDNWADTADMLPPACLGVLVGGSVSVACQGYLFAREDAAAVVRSGLLQTVTAFAVALPLVPWIGLWGFGLGLLASNAAGALVLARAVQRHTGARLLRPLVTPTSASVLGGALGWWTTAELGNTLVAGMLGGSVAMLVMAGVLAIVDRSLLIEVARVVREMLGAVRRGQPKTPDSTSR